MKGKEADGNVSVKKKPQTEANGNLDSKEKSAIQGLIEMTHHSFIQQPKDKIVLTVPSLSLGNKERRHGQRECPQGYVEMTIHKKTANK